MTKYNWHGCDANKAISIFEQGLLVRYIPKHKQWECMYQAGAGPKLFLFGYTDNIEVVEPLETGWAVKDRKSFLSFIGMNWEDWLQSSMINKIYDYIAYFGTNNLFGSYSSEPENVKQICKRLKIKYDKEYEN